jgi:eukaryotic-like serine/threonine-protein kinase
LEFKPFKMGKYLLMERLATGGMAEVYRAKAEGAGGFEKQMAIKRILPTYSQNDEFRKMFEYEARLSSMLTHANIVQVYDFNKIGETYLLAMEFVDGKNLRQFVNKCKKANVNFPIEFTVFVMNEVCKGLDYAHGKKDDMTGRPLNIIHRDMSPQNIMLSYEGAVKIVDFGIAKAKDRADETRSGVIKGKFGYMSPEQANGMSVDHRTDLFSTGIILWELLTGRRLFAAESDLATLRMIQECVITPPSKINPRVPPELEKIVMKILSKDLKLRYNSAGDVHRQLLEYLSKSAPAFTQREVSQILHLAFSDEISKEKKRFEQIYRQSIPFSQGAPKEEKRQDDLEGVEQALDGFQTKSDIVESTGETFSDGKDESEGADHPPAGTVPSYSVESEAPVASEASVNTKSQISVPTEGGDPSPILGADYEPAAPNESTRLGTGIDLTGSEAKGEVDLVLPGGRKHSFNKKVAEPAPSRRASSALPEAEVPSPETQYRPKPTEPADKATWQQAKIVSMGEEVPAPERPSEHDATEAAPKSAPDSKGVTEPSIIPAQIALKQEFKRAETRSHAPFGQNGKKGSTGIEVEKRTPTTAPQTSRAFQIDRRKTPRKKRVMGPGSFLFASLFVLFFGYRLLFSGQLENYLEKNAERIPTTQKDGTEAGDGALEKTSPLKKSAGDCVRSVLSHPAAAQVFVRGQLSGETPVVLAGQCGTATEVVLKKEGYEDFSASIDFRKGLDAWETVLKETSLGQLELNLTFNAEVYIDGTLTKEAKQREVLLIALRAKKTYKIRLINKPLGIDYDTEVSIEPGQKTTVNLGMDQANSKSAPRPAKLRK